MEAYKLLQTVLFYKRAKDQDFSGIVSLFVHITHPQSRIETMIQLNSECKYGRYLKSARVVVLDGHKSFIQNYNWFSNFIFQIFTYLENQIVVCKVYLFGKI